MQPSRRPCIYASFALLLSFAAPRTFAKNLTISSTPSGARVEINGVEVCKTPCHLDYPGGYFHKTITVFGSRLMRPLTARVYSDGYAVQEISLTEGPFEWVALNGKDRGQYWLLKSHSINVLLDPLSHVLTGTIRTRNARGELVNLGSDMPVEKVAENASPAVVRLVGTAKEGTGFFITSTGVIATNAHVARGESSLIVESPGRAKLLAKIVYVDPKLDLALAKVEGEGFPYLTLASIENVRVGETVVAIGNPANGMPDTVTSGIVSAVGKYGPAGPGTWIQTDAAINPGNSGGPLLDTRGETIGLNTQVAISGGTNPVPLEGIGFSLSADDLIRVLRRLYPDTVSTPEGRTEIAEGSGAATSLVPESAQPRTGEIAVSSKPTRADIYVDGIFVGQTPATLQLASGVHHFQVKFSNGTMWERSLDVLTGSELSLNASLSAP